MAAKPVADYIEVMYPDLYAETSKMNFYIDVATDMTSASFFGTMNNYAIALRAMHMAAIDAERPQGDSGLIVAKSEGNVSVRYQHRIDKGHYSDLSMTHWGQRLLALIKTRGGSISVSADPVGLIEAVSEEF